jgi:hypothetical protein
MNRNRTAGNSFELEIVNAFKKAGYLHAVSSRSENRTRDAEKVDIVNHNEFKNGRLEYNIQCKNVSGPIPYQKLLEEIEELKDITNVVIHKKTERVNNKFMPRGKYAFLYLKDFLMMVETIKTQENKIKQLENGSIN